MNRYRLKSADGPTVKARFYPNASTEQLADLAGPGLLYATLRPKLDCVDLTFPDDVVHRVGRYQFFLMEDGKPTCYDRNDFEARYIGSHETCLYRRKVAGTDVHALAFNRNYIDDLVEACGGALSGFDVSCNDSWATLTLRLRGHQTILLSEGDYLYKGTDAFFRGLPKASFESKYERCVG